MSEVVGFCFRVDVVCVGGFGRFWSFWVGRLGSIMRIVFL